MNFFRKNKKLFKNNNEIAPDEIFLDSSNLPDFDTYQFEGRLERAISKKVIFSVGAFFVLVAVAFSFRLWILQVNEGGNYLSRSENNHLRQSLIFPQRGIVYDRNNIELAWNMPSSDNKFSKRSYTDLKGLSHLLGYVSYPLKDKFGNFYQTEYVGKGGVEKFFNNQLSGNNGVKIMAVDALSQVQSENVVQKPMDGININLSVDSRIQNALYGYIENLSNEIGFSGGAGVIMDIESGELLAVTSYPEYRSDILSDGDNSEVINGYINNQNKPFLNRLTTGLYTPGSIVKPIVALAALNENTISSEKSILSRKSISIPNPYYPDKKTIFTDWKAHGWVDMRSAIAMSSNVYFYAVGGGFEDQKGLGISNLYKYFTEFGFGEKTGIEIENEKNGIVPNPDWKKEVFDGDNWRIGDTYYTSIGQYGFQITPLQAVRAISAIANSGKLLTPTIVLKGDMDEKEKQSMFSIDGIISSLNSQEFNNTKEIDINKEHFIVVKEGMREAVTDGTAKGLNLYFIDIAAKTGTAELGISKRLVNSWIVGFFPYDKPRYAFTVIMERGPRENTVGGLYVMRQLLEWMNVNTPEYLE
ncbi:peptidoglycan D,D-transpeptidase FtsI family protein [Patescibacteria group bacterium]